MPIFHYQLSAGPLGPDGKPIRKPDGSIVLFPPHHLLGARGPVVQVSANIPQELAAQLTLQQKPIPGSISGWGLIDTGATMSCIDSAAAQQLGLPVIDVIKMCSASHAATPCKVYPLSFDIFGIGGAKVTVNSPRTAEAALSPQGLLLLIGRDLLANCLFVYNGPSGEFTITF